jgi:hypothetical protein
MVEGLMREKFSRKPRMPVLNREIAPDEDPFVRLSSPPAGLEGESDDGRNIISSNESLIESEGNKSSVPRTWLQLAGGLQKGHAGRLPAATAVTAPADMERRKDLRFIN